MYLCIQHEKHTMKLENDNMGKSSISRTYIASNKSVKISKGGSLLSKFSRKQVRVNVQIKRNRYTALFSDQLFHYLQTFFYFDNSFEFLNIMLSALFCSNCVFCHLWGIELSVAICYICTLIFFIKVFSSCHTMMNSQVTAHASCA